MKPELIIQAKEDLVKCAADGEEFAVKALLYQNGELVGAMLPEFTNDEEKRLAFKEIGKFCASQGVDSMGICLDAMMRKVEPGHEHDPTEYPSTYPESMRQDALVIQYVDFRNLRNNKTRVIAYEKKGTKISFATDSELDQANMSGQLEGCLMVGFMLRKINDMGDADSTLTIRDATEKFMSEWFQGLNELPYAQQSLGMGFD
jgi:hypothetical protein